jgi:hypothetical protein
MRTIKNYLKDKISDKNFIFGGNFLHITNTGNIGLGTINPSASLHIYSDTGAGMIYAPYVPAFNTTGIITSTATTFTVSGRYATVDINPNYYGNITIS